MKLFTQMLLVAVLMFSALGTASASSDNGWLDVGYTDYSWDSYDDYGHSGDWDDYVYDVSDSYGYEADYD